MDLKSLKEKKAMLTESYEVERILIKPPFEFEPLNLSAQTKLNLDKLGDICKILKPNSLEMSTTLAINASLIDLEHRQFTKQSRLKCLEVELKNIQEKHNLVTRLQNEVKPLELEGNRPEGKIDDVFEAKKTCTEKDETKIILDSLKDINEKYTEAGIDPQLHSRLLAESENFQKLKGENESLVQRLRSIPVDLGFELTMSNIQKLLDEKQEQLEELKNQVLKASVLE